MSTTEKQYESAPSTPREWQMVVGNNAKLYQPEQCFAGAPSIMVREVLPGADDALAAMAWERDGAVASANAAERCMHEMIKDRDEWKELAEALQAKYRDHHAEAERLTDHINHVRARREFWQRQSQERDQWLAEKDARITELQSQLDAIRRALP